MSSAGVSLAFREGPCHVCRMVEVFSRVVDSLFSELAAFLAAIETNLGLLSHIVKDVLNGEADDLLKDEERFAEALDEVLYRVALAALDILSSLQDQMLNLSAEQQAKLSFSVNQYDELTARWRSLCEAICYRPNCDRIRDRIMTVVI